MPFARLQDRRDRLRPGCRPARHAGRIAGADPPSWCAGERFSSRFQL